MLYITMDSPWMGVVYEIVKVAQLESHIYTCYPEWVTSWEFLKEETKKTGEWPYHYDMRYPPLDST